MTSFPSWCDLIVMTLQLLIQCCPIINPFSLGTLMVNDYVLLVTRGRGGRGTHNQIYPGKVHRENMDTKHHQATHGNHSLYHSEDRRQIRKNIFHTCLFSPTSRNSVSCLHVWQKWFLLLEYIGICVDVISQHIWGLFERKGVNLNSNYFECDTKNKITVNVILIEQCWNLILL